MSEFRDRVFSVLMSIPKGSVLTYTQVAGQAGNAKASRAVGNIIGTNFDPDIPCHRVVRSNGELGGYNRGVEQKKKLLTQEGVLFITENRVAL